MIVIIDYGMGNLESIKNMLKRVGSDSVISHDILDIEKADKLILPGVGAFDNAMKNINDIGLLSVINKKVIKDKTPILGICLGMQLMTKSSEEGKMQGLGWINAKTVKFKFNQDSQLKIPHMGWNTLKIEKQSKIFGDMYNQENKFYFVHSYHVICNDKEDVLTTTSYGYDFTSSIEKNNIIGVQFHPEKSHKFGMQLLKNFTMIS